MHFFILSRVATEWLSLLGAASPWEAAVTSSGSDIGMRVRGQYESEAISFWEPQEKTTIVCNERSQMPRVRAAQGFLNLHLKEMRGGLSRNQNGFPPASECLRDNCGREGRGGGGRGIRGEGPFLELDWQAFSARRSTACCRYCTPTIHVGYRLHDFLPTPGPLVSWHFNPAVSNPHARFIS